MSAARGRDARGVLRGCQVLRRAGRAAAGVAGAGPLVREAPLRLAGRGGIRV